MSPVLSAPSSPSGEFHRLAARRDTVWDTLDAADARFRITEAIDGVDLGKPELLVSSRRRSIIERRKRYGPCSTTFELGAVRAVGRTRGRRRGSPR